MSKKKAKLLRQVARKVWGDEYNQIMSEILIYRHYFSLPFYKRIFRNPMKYIKKGN